MRDTRSRQPDVPGEQKIQGEDSDLEELRVEKQHLLEELAMAYRQMEQVLSTSQFESEIAYRELRRRNEELQRRLSDLEDAQEKLREAHKMLVRDERLTAMGQMAAAVVHDLNGPLAVIVGSIELLLMRDTDPMTKERLEAIEQAVQRMRELSTNMLDLSGRNPTSIEAMSINELVAGVLRFLSPLTQEASIHIDLADDVPSVRANWPQLEQVLTNLVMNALDATERVTPRELRLTTGCCTVNSIIAREEAGGRSTHVASHLDPQEMDSDWIYAGVEDNGHGISDDELSKVFEVFYTTKGDSGSGLGLAISKRIAEDQRGTILVASRAGGGTSFSLLLPVVRL